MRSEIVLNDIIGSNHALWIRAGIIKVVMQMTMGSEWFCHRAQSLVSNDWSHNLESHNRAKNVLKCGKNTQ